MQDAARARPSAPSTHVFVSHSCPFVVQTLLGLRFCIFVVLPLHPPSCFSCISCFSWFKHCLDYAFLHIRVHSCPFVVQASIWTTFVSIRVHSWFSLFPLLRVFSCFSCFSWFKHRLDHVFVHSCPFVVHPLHPPSRLSCFSWFKHCLDYAFLHIRVHSCPFVVQASIWTTFVSIRVHSWFSLFPLLRVFSCFSCFSWFKHRLDYVFCIFVSIRVHSWFSLFTLLRVFSCFSCFSWFDSPFSLLPICPFFTLFKEIDVK